MCEIGLCTSHHLGKVVACIFSPPPPNAGSYHFHPHIGSDKPLRQRCLRSPHQQPCSPIQSCQPDYISDGRGGKGSEVRGGVPKEKEMSSRRQTTKHIVCPAAAHLPIHIHLSPRLPHNQSICLHHSPVDF